MAQALSDVVDCALAHERLATDGDQSGIRAGETEQIRKAGDADTLMGTGFVAPEFGQPESVAPSHVDCSQVVRTVESGREHRQICPVMGSADGDNSVLVERVDALGDQSRLRLLKRP